MKRNGLLAGAGLFAVALIAASCAPDPRPARFPAAPVILVSVDTLRSDRLSAYGYTGLRTPAFDGFAADAVLFERSYSHYPLTLPSHASILTGLLPPDHGVRDNRGFELGTERTSLAELLSQAGYATGGFVSSMVLRESTGIAQGFDVYDDAMPTARSEFGERRGEVTAAMAIRWLESVDSERPPFLFLHLFDPHTPYTAPEPFASAHDDPYLAEIAYTDSILSTLFDRLKEIDLYDRSLIVLLSDHGEGLGDHVEKEHGLLLYRESLQVPLMIKLPGQSMAGRRIELPVGLIDVATTILDVLGLPSADLPGRALLGSEPVDPGDGIYGETFFPTYQYGWAELKSVIRGDRHYIQAPRPELYDLRADPSERHDLASGGAIPPSMVDVLDAIGRGTENRSAVSAEDSARLAALGYVGGGGVSPVRNGIDPKDRIQQVERLWDLVRGSAGSAGPTSAGEIRGLLDELARGNEPVHRAAAHRLWSEGRLELAFELLEPFSGSDAVETQLLRGKIATVLGRGVPARSAFERVLAIADLPEAQAGLGTLALTENRPQEALRLLQAAVNRDPALADAWNSLGVVHARAGAEARALEAWRNAVGVDPGLQDAWYNIARVSERSGDRKAAIDALRRFVALAEGREQAEGRALLGRLVEGLD